MLNITITPKYALEIEDATISALLPLVTTGSTYLKSPPKMTSFPPNRQFLLQMSLMEHSIASRLKRCVIGASSHMIIDASLIS